MWMQTLWCIIFGVALTSSSGWSVGHSVLHELVVMVLMALEKKLQPFSSWAALWTPHGTFDSKCDSNILSLISRNKAQVVQKGI